MSTLIKRRKIAKRASKYDLFSEIYELYHQQNNCDLVLISKDDKKINVHSFVVLAGIPKLRDDLLNTSTLKRLLHTKDVYRVSHVKSYELELAVQYSYLHQCDLKEQDPEATIELLTCAKHLQMLELQAYCVEVLKKNMNMTTAVSLIAPGEKRTQDLKDAHEIAELFVLRHLTSDQTGAHIDICVDLLESLIRDHRLHTFHEEVVWEMMVRWVEHNNQARSHLMPNLLLALRVGMLPPAYVTQLRSHPLIAENTRAMHALNMMRLEVSTVYYAPHAIVSLPLPLSLCPRLPHVVILASGGKSISKNTGLLKNVKTFEAYDYHAERWVKVKKLVMPTHSGPYHGLEVLGQFIYLIGGFKRDFISTSCFDMKDLTWKRMCPLSHRRILLATTVLNGRLYAIGGQRDDHILNTVEVFDPNVGHWSIVSSMMEKRCDAAVAVLNGFVYVLGGYDENQGVLRTVEYYNPVRDEWTSAAPLIVPRRGHRCSTYRDHIFAVGGQGPFHIGPLNSVERYDSKSNTWSLMAPMQTARYNFGMAHLDERIFVCGGRDHVGLLSTCEIYHILEDKWYPMSSMLETRAGLSCCVIDNIEFSSWALSSIVKRDDVKLLRDRDVPRPPYINEDIAHELPPSSGRLQTPILEPLPSPWVEMFVGYMQDMIVEVDVEERNEEQLRLALVPMFQVAVPGPDDVAVRVDDENEAEDVVDESYEF